MRDNEISADAQAKISAAAAGSNSKISFMESVFH